MEENNSYLEVKSGSEKGFGFTFFIIFLIYSLYSLFQGKDHYIFSLFASFSMLLITLFIPRILYKPNKAWFKLGLLLGKIVAPLTMLAVFILTVLPIGLILKVFKKDLLQQRIEKDKISYWLNREKLITSMKNQF